MTVRASLPLRYLHEQRNASFVEAFGLEVPARYGDPRREYEAASSSAALADVSYVGKMLVSGPDAREFLQGLVTNDVSGLAPGHALPACLLTAQGKLTADFWLH